MPGMAIRKCCDQLEKEDSADAMAGIVGQAGAHEECSLFYDSRFFSWH